MPGAIVILSAIDRELQAVVKRLGLRWQGSVFVGEYRGKPIRARFTGMGKFATYHAIDTACREGSVSRVLHVGFAGGLDPSLNAGHIVNARWIVNAVDSRVAVLGDGVPSIEPQSPLNRLRRDSLLTSDELVPTIEAKSNLFKRWDAAAVEMESFHAAVRAAEKSLRLTAIRAVSDPAPVVLLPEAMDWVRSDGRSDTFAAARFAVTHPHRIPALVQLGRHASLAAQALAAEVERVLASEE